MKDPFADPTCRYVGCTKQSVRGIRVCLEHERAWDRLSPAARLDYSRDLEARSAAWQRFLRGEL